MSKATYKGDVVHTERYTDKQTGEEKKKYTKVGAYFEYDDGGKFVKIFDSFFNIYPPKVNEEGYKQAKQAVEATPTDLEDEIPF